MNFDRADQYSEVVNLEDIKREVTDFATNIGEVALDCFLKDGPVREIPVIGSLLGLFRGYRSVRDQVFVLKLARFILFSPSIEPEKRRKFKERLAQDKEFARDTATHLTLVLERLDAIEKAFLLARIFGSLIEGRIDESQMRRLSTALDRALVADLFALRDFVRDRKPLSREHYDGLESAGLASAYHSIVRPIREGELEGRTDQINFLLSATALLLVEVAL